MIQIIFYYTGLCFPNILIKSSLFICTTLHSALFTSRFYFYCRHYRSARVETPSHPGGVSDAYRRKHRDDKSRGMLAAESKKSHKSCKSFNIFNIVVPKDKKMSAFITQTMSYHEDV